MRKTVLILGSNGRIGRHCSEHFWNAGWTVRLFDRKTDNLMDAAKGADVIVAGWNPPYPQWADQVPGLHASIQEAARKAGATVVLPGNVYVFGPDTPPPWRETTAHAARNPLGRIRIELEQSYRDSGVQTIILRAGDFIDTQASGIWLDKVMMPTVPRGHLIYPGVRDIPHAWAFLPDLARAIEMLSAQKEELEQFEDITFPGFTLSGEDLAEHLTEIFGRKVKVRRMNWLPLKLAQPFWPMARALLEMRYLWDTPHWLESDRFQARLPGFSDTPVADALKHASAPWLHVAKHPKRRFHSICRSTQTSR
ncbi:MAG: epimerase [Pseudomonadota bacterium]